MGKWWNNLSPQQRRYAAVIGVGALLGLAVLLRRKGAEPEVDESADQAPVAASAEPGAPFAPGSTFADNGEAAGQLGTAITEGLGAVGEGLEGVGAGFERLEDKIDSLGQTEPAELPAIAPGPAGEIGLPAGGQARTAKAAPQSNSGSKSTPKSSAAKKSKAKIGVAQARPVSPPPKPKNVTGGGGGVAHVGGAGGASGGQVHPNAYSSGISVKKAKPNPPRGYHTYKGANGQWWFAPN